MTSSNTDSPATTLSDQASAHNTSPSAIRFNTALFAALLALATGVAVSGWLQLDSQKNLFARLEHQYRSDVDSLRAELDGISIVVNQQAALLQRTVGTVLPFKIPEETEHELVRIENELAGEEELSSAQVEMLNRAFESAIASLPSWAQSELLPRTLPLRWQLESHKLLAHYIDEPDLSDFQAYQEELSAYAEARPPGAPGKLADMLQLRASGAEMMVEYLLDQRLAAEREQQFRQSLEMRIEAIEAEVELYERIEDAALKARLASSTHAAIEDLQIALATTELDIGELGKRASAIAAQSAQHLGNP